MNALEVMLWPTVACLVASPLLVYLGLHVVQREVIFVDLALAQVATLGTAIALFLNYDLHDAATFWISFGVTCLAAALFSISRGSVRRHVPQEAVIGITFVVAAATAVLLLDKVPEGSHHVHDLLVGNILSFTATDAPRHILIFAALSGFYAALHRKFKLITFETSAAYAQGLHVRLWDFLFYAGFGLVVVSFVQIAGVLLMFSYLVAPAVCAVMLARRLAIRLLLGCGMAVAATLLGSLASLPFLLDAPPGAAIVCAFGLLLGLVSMAVVFRRRQS